MNPVIADRIAREHAETMMADAARARLVREARRARRRRAKISGGDGAASSVAGEHPRAVAAAHVIGRPFSAVHAWLVAGEL